VAALTRLVERTVDCYAGPFERVEHQPAPRCGRWYAALLRGGDAAAYAIGEVRNRPGSAWGVLADENLPARAVTHVTRWAAQPPPARRALR